MNEEEKKSQATEVLQEMITRLGIAAEIAVEPGDNDNFKLEIKSAEAGRLIGRKGQSLESLELLLNRILKRNDEEAPWVPVEVDGYSTGRTGDIPKHHGGERLDVARFQAMAIDAAKEVRRWRNPKKLGPFNPAERRQIHITLQDDPELMTESEPVSEGKNMKYVIIKLRENSAE